MSEKDNPKKPRIRDRSRSSKNKKTKEDYEVGYGKPPKHTRFKKGQSGNLRGRPKNAKSYKTIVEKLLNSEITIKENGNTRKVTAREAVALKVLQKALSGDLKAAKEIMNIDDLINEKNEKEQLQEEKKQKFSKTDQKILDDFIKQEIKSRK